MIKKILVFLIIVLFALGGILFLLKADIVDKYAFYQDDSEWTIKPFRTSDGVTLVFPSFWDVSRVKCADNKNNKDLDCSFVSKGDSICASGEIAEKLSNRRGQFCVYQSKVATIMINTTSKSLKQLNKGKECEDSGDILIVDSTGQICYEGRLESIHGRGNSTWSADKKPYNIKLDKKSSLLGLKSMKSYCLLANSYDHSNVRNYIAYKTALQFGTASPVDCEFVSLYINGEYLGLYLLTTKPTINTNSVNIKDLEKITKKLNAGVEYKSWEYGFGKGVLNGSLSADCGAMKGVDGWYNPDDITGGYIIESTGHISSFNDKPSGFITSRNIPISIREPKFATKEQVKYISTLFDKIENVMATQDGVDNDNERKYSEYIDVESFVKYYLIQEAFLTVGPGLGSFKMYKNSDLKEDDRLFAGPIWDFDNSMANADIEFMQMPEMLYALQGMANHPQKYRGLLSDVMQLPGTLSLAKRFYTEDLDTLLRHWFIEGCFEGLVSHVSFDSYLNEMRWPVTRGKSFVEDVGLIKSFMIKRIGALSSFFSSGDDYLDHCVFVDAGFTECSGIYNIMTFYCPNGIFTPPMLNSYYGSNKPYTMIGIRYQGSNQMYTPTTINSLTKLEYLWKIEE